MLVKLVKLTIIHYNKNFDLFQQKNGRKEILSADIERYTFLAIHYACLILKSSLSAIIKKTGGQTIDE
jgi:hypothetical protein